ncbi:MAG: substrate-binding domain-containing protein [Bdellovibrionales bacterium]|nr:substrate-binding domain-containing protein [Bdellovibrionales bacterium]
MRHPAPKTVGFFLSCAALLAVAAPAEARDQIKIVGSSTVYPFATVVAERLGSSGKLKTPVIESTGTGGGMKLFCAGVGEGHPDITNASRKIKDSEVEMCRQNGVTDIVEIIVGNDGIVFANSVKAPQQNLTKEQLWKAMAAKGPKPMMWSEIDPSLPKEKIVIFTPPPTSGTRDAWNELVMEKGCDPKVKEANEKDCALMREDGPVVEAGENDALLVQKLEANPAAFAIFGFSYLDSNQDTIQASKIGGTEATLESIQRYDYAIARPLYFYVKKAHVGVIPGIKEYVEEFTSPAAMSDDGYLSDIGLVPLDDEKRQAVRSTAVELKTMTP